MFFSDDVKGDCVGDIQIDKSERYFMSSGARPLPDGRKQEPGGWNRIVLEVDDLPSRVEALKKAGLRFRNEIEKGPGGKQIQLEDPDGNPIELFEPAK